MNNARVLLILIFVVMVFLLLVIRLINIQIIKSDELSYFANKQHTSTDVIKSDRGFIYDRNGVLLVYNKVDYSFYIDLRMLPGSEKEKLAKLFAKVMDQNKIHYLKLLKTKKKTVCIERRVPFEKAVKLIDYQHPAYFYVEEPSSVFHYGSLASHILGYVNSDYKAESGVSKSFDDILRGDDGYRLVERNAMGDIISISEDHTRDPVPGDDIYLTIDKRYQSIVEEELKKSLELTSGESAICIIMNPNSGEIISLANINDYDPNHYWKYDDFERKNRAITDSYEPGSTFKVITLAALLEENACTEDERINVENGEYKFRSNYIRDTHKFQFLSVRGVIEESSNIGVAKLIQRISDDKYYQYVRDFGFGTYTSVQLPGEVTGKLSELGKWSKLTKTYMSFGYGISVTPLQLTNAFCALINGGVLYQPQIVQKQVDKNGNIIKESSPILIRRVISEDTSERIRNLLVGAVKNGTGKQAGIDSISVGGKTGTSKIIVDGKYSEDKYYSSFIGFYPVDAPQFVCYILINKPKGNYYGGLVAAPVFKSILERILSLEEGNSIQPKPQNDINIVDNRPLQNTEELLSYDKGQDQITSNVENIFISNENLNVMPDLRGLSIKEALMRLNELGIQCRIAGSGVVIEQSIAPGSAIKNRISCLITCSQVVTNGARIY